MCDKLYIKVEDTGNSKLLVLFNTLEEEDKDIIIKISELLVGKWQNNMTNIVINNFEKANGYNCLFK